MSHTETQAEAGLTPAKCQLKLKGGNMNKGKIKIEISDRYSALGIPRPNPKTVCKGNCEGTGWVPIKKDDERAVFRKLWLESEKLKPSDDDWHFVKCPDCKGTGKRC